MKLETSVASRILANGSQPKFVLHCIQATVHPFRTNMQAHAHDFDWLTLWPYILRWNSQRGAHMSQLDFAYRDYIFKSSKKKNDQDISQAC
jgi:hypothetical protein